MIYVYTIYDISIHCILCKEFKTYQSSVDPTGRTHPFPFTSGPSTSPCSGTAARARSAKIAAGDPTAWVVTDGMLLRLREDVN